MSSAIDEVSTGIKGSISVVTEALLNKVALEKMHLVPGCSVSYHQFTVFIIALGGRTLFHPNPLAGNFFHNAIVVIAVFVNKPQRVIMNVEVAVPALVTQ